MNDVAEMNDDATERIEIIPFDGDPQIDSVSGQHLGVLHRLLRHNIRNHLTTIRGNGELVRDDASGDIAMAGETIVKEADKIGKMAENEMLLIRIIQEQPEPVRLRLQYTLSRAVTELRDRYPSAEIDLETNSDPSVLAIDSIDRAIEELIENSIVHNSGPAPEVRVWSEDTDDRIRVIVADDSEPIPKQDVEVLRDIETKKPLFHASGLGLWMVRWIVEFSEGGLELFRNENTGNKVVVTLPKADV